MNPYNYQDPVNTRAELADREESVNEIEYYLDEAASGNLFNMAITGERGIGKSSLMNIGQAIAEDLGLMSIDVPIGQLNTVDELEFYKGIFEEILAQGSRNGYIGESWLDSFRNALAGAEEEVSIGYSSTYFRIKSSSESTSDLPRKQIIDDFEEINKKVESPAIALFIDDAHLLIENQVLFRKFYSILDDVGSFFVVLSGHNLEQRIPESIGPLRKSFTTIELTEFDEQRFTEDSLLKPLPDPEQADFDQDRISDIHRITGGHPYEIKLVAHHMYKEYQLGSESITIDSDVLSDVVNSLEVIRDSKQDLLFDKINQMSDEQLRLLVYLLEMPKCSEKWLLQYSLLRDRSMLSRKNVESTKETRRQLLNQLEGLGLITKSEEGLEFAGEIFDRIFLKYHAVDQGVLDIDNFSPHRNSSPRQAVYNEIINQGFNQSEFDYRFITKFDFIYDILPEKDETRFIQWQTIHKTGKITVESGEWETILEWKVGEFLEESEESIWFRCNLSWVPTGFLTKVILLDDHPEPKKHLRKKIKKLSSNLEVLSYEFILDDEMTFFKRAQKAFEEGELDIAEELLNESVEVYPFFYPAWRNIGLIHSKRGHNQSARVFYKMGLELGGKNTDIVELLAESYRANDLYSKAIELLEESLTRENVEARPRLLKLTQIQLESGNLTEAIQAFERYRDSNI